MTDEQAARRVVDIITGAWQSQALYAAVTLNLPDLIAAGHTGGADLARRAGTSADGLTRLMRLLTAIGVCAGSYEDGYRLTPAGELLRTDAEQSMSEMVRIYGEEFRAAWGAIVPAVRTGTSGFEHAFQQPLGAYLASEPGAGAKFLRAMNAGSVFFEEVAAAHDFSGARTVLDVAGGSGVLLAAVLRAHPHLHGTVLDLPHMMPVAREQLAAAVGPERYDTVPGDAFEEVPAGHEVYLLSRVLQDWDDERCVRLLSRIRAAMGTASRLLVLERVIPTAGSALLPVLWDLHLLMAAGGRERTRDGYEELFSRAGLRVTAVRDLALETTLLTLAPS
ncbi:methyltransferase [Streptomyces niger]|uniref:methyltransferase n=1 Tax=Streptomyces niger TaxID=66373 RepID=UPI00069938BA|nr:methyltransferase [Streptomyces niger]